MIPFEELKKRLVIDKSVLDDEVIRQPVLFYEISEQLTEALAERDAAKEALANTDAFLDGQWRMQLSKAKGGVGRITDKMVTSCIQTDDDHKASFDDYLAAKTRADKLLALKEAFQQRSYMLRDLVALYSANYYEDSSMKPTRAQENSQYAANRHRLSVAREKRSGG